MKRSWAIFLVMILALALFTNANASLVDNLDGTVTDTETGLMWQQNGSMVHNWYSANNYCDNLFLGGYDDWYLPNLTTELITILDTSVSPPSAPAIDLTIFPGTSATSYWTSTEGVSSGYAYGLMFHNLQSNHANLLVLWFKEDDMSWKGAVQLRRKLDRTQFD